MRATMLQILSAPLVGTVRRRDGSWAPVRAMAEPSRTHLHGVTVRSPRLTLSSNSPRITPEQLFSK
jgi:hypothetical protein